MTTFVNPVGRKLQVPKEDLYMFTALWMQESPWAVDSTENLNVVGSVFVLPNDRVLSADCTRQHPDHNTSVHGAIRPLIKFPDKVKGCEVYLTRKPCAHCVKMLVQARVSKVFYLPLQPEKPKGEKDENKSVDALFQVSEVSKSVYVPNISQQHIDELKKAQENSLYENNNDILAIIEKEPEWNDFLKGRDGMGWDDDWISKIKDDLDWQEFGDDGIEKQVRKDMDNAFKWFYLATHGTGESTLAKDGTGESTLAKDGTGESTLAKDGTGESTLAKDGTGESTNDRNPWEFGDKENDEKETTDEQKVRRQKRRKQQTHLSRLAQMLSNRTDDPKESVGCVIVDEKEIVSIGWNGFPSKALFGNHPRNNRPHTKPKYEKKYPHVIHAEQNALLSRNQRNLKNSVAYVNRIPCNNCMSMLYELGVRTLVLPFIEVQIPPDTRYVQKCFYGLLNDTKITVLRPKKNL